MLTPISKEFSLLHSVLHKLVILRLAPRYATYIYINGEGVVTDKENIICPGHIFSSTK